ncbi:hypothetical protein PsorP6_016491 [Peronosclerospora sorghi]|uniref:Uncharacterized protein n=1 Tax=Peronosclerospora sorghi TaxID=230839 RepID=A0ACC0VNJ0_9STRA|nr:hypothetical protein PsorP6_016491 [Peronosclerospora sorghi]
MKVSVWMLEATGDSIKCTKDIRRVSDKAATIYTATRNGTALIGIERLAQRYGGRNGVESGKSGTGKVHWMTCS